MGWVFLLKYLEYINNSCISL